MSNIRIDLNHAPLDGETVSFKAPCNASDITGMVIYYADNSGAEASREFTLSDANGGNIGLLDNVFAEGAIVKVILDTDLNNAFVQNPDTNTYLEGKFAEVASAAATAQTAADNAASAAAAAQTAAGNAQTTANGKADASHNQAASTITAGTFAGAVVAGASNQAVGTALLRNSKIVSSDTNPTNNGEICWKYE